MENGSFSILYPYKSAKFKTLSSTAAHDLALDVLCTAASDDQREQRLIMDTLSKMTDHVPTAVFRSQVFRDILSLPELRRKMMELFEKIEYYRSSGSMHRTVDREMGIWHLYQRLDELDTYIKCVETMQECLSDEHISSEGLAELRKNIDELYNDSAFAEMKEDISALKIKATEVRSITVGINVNDRLEAVSMGLVSVNAKPFKKSGIVSNFADKIAAKDRISPDSEWNGDMHFQELDKEHEFFSLLEKGAARMTPLAARSRATLSEIAEGDGTRQVPVYIETLLNKMLGQMVRRLREVLTKYANITIVNISALIPEFIYYIRMAEFVEQLMKQGYVFGSASASEDTDTAMHAEGFYNLRLAIEGLPPSEIVENSLDFDREHTIYILTGANRGGKTTITQAVGMLYVLAQGGILVTAKDMTFTPVDCIYTHFPADEDKTVNMGRLGEECVRFKEIYNDCTEHSLVLLNETFSTTSFDEGYYIACDSVRALSLKNVRTIYNTHMHKLAEDMENLTEKAAVASLVMKNEGGKRCFKAYVGKPEGRSYAQDIAEKYGVTFEMLTSKSEVHIQTS